MIGEKYLNINNYLTGTDGGDNESMYVGFDNDVNRTTDTQPLRDSVISTSTDAFGSAHPGAFNMLMCDGSVRTIEYSITLTVFQPAGRRNG